MSSSTVKRAFSGFAVIVAGVLAALAGDAAWSNRVDRALERELLSDLRNEFEENARRLESDIASVEAHNARAVAWADGALGRSEVSDDSLTTLFAMSAMAPARFDPVSGVLRSIIASGQLDLIRDKELRQALAGWPDRTLEAQLSADRMAQTKDNLIPVLVGIEPGNRLTVGERAAVRLYTFPLSLRRLRELRDHLGEVIRLIELQPQL